jgi:hypothetical protein
MKAYELIWKLLRHPFADVRFSGYISYPTVVIIGISNSIPLTV